MSDQTTAGTGVSARVRIVGWIILTTAFALLAVTLTMRSIMVRQATLQANQAVTQELQEFQVFAREGIDPSTGTRFTDMSTLVERYLSLQTLSPGEVVIGIVPGHDVQVADNAGGQGRELSQNHVKIGEIVDHPRVSGIVDTDYGEVRWGKQVVEIGTAGQTERGVVIVATFTQQAIDEAQQQSAVLFAVALGGLLLTAGIAWLVAARILSPIRDMERAAREISADDLTQRLPVRGRDDIAALATTLNTMLDRLERSYASKHHFLAEAQSQLAPPRDRIAALLDQAAAPGVTEGQRFRLAAEARQELALMESKLRDLEVLASIDSPSFVRPRSVAVGDLTRALATRFAADPSSRVVLEGVAEVEATLDAERVTHAVEQLVANAAAQSGPGGTVGIGSAVCADDPTLVDLWVSDTGEQVDAEQARAMFEDLRTSDSGSPEGMGLGLAVVRAVADAHRGSAWIESTPASTKVGLRLPIVSPLRKEPA